MMSISSNTLLRQGCPLHYWLEGDADKPLLVMTHGATLDHRMFEAQRKALLPSHRLLTWDMRGHGESQPMGDDFTVPTAVDDLLAILDEIGVKTATLLGQSTGGYVVQELMFRHPERVEALVMIDCICITLRISAMEAFLLRLTPALLSLYPDKLLKKQTATQSSIRPEIQAYIYEAACRIPKREIITIWRGIASCLHAEPEYRIKKPLLLVHGDQDKLGNIAKSAPQWAARDPHCQYVVIPDAGHCANQDNASYFNEVLLSFLVELKQPEETP
jgi:3-oxoadipate enol-lactonase